VNGETLTDTQNKTLTTLETTLKKLDPSQSTYLLSIIDYLKAIKDKKTDVQVNVQNSKDEQNSEEYSMAQQIIQNMKSLDEAKFAQNKKDWSKQLFAVSEDEWNNYKTSKIAQLQNEMQQAQSEFSNDPSNTYLSDEVASKSNDIANLQKQNYKDIYDWEQTFTDVHQQRIAQLEEENKLQQEKEEKLKRENDLLQKEKELNDTLNNKDVETITKDANGNWQTSYVSDQTKVDELQKSIGEQMQSNNDADRQQKIENEKEFENDLINTQKNAYDKLVKDQQNILDKKYANMNYLVETFLGEIKSEYGSDSNVVKSVLSGMLNRTEGDLRDFTIKSSGYIKEMVDYIKSLKIEVKQSGADVSAVVNGIPSVSNGTATTDQIQKLNDLLNDPNPSPDMVKFKEDMFSSDPTKQAEAKQIIAKYLPSETDVDKWLQTQNDAYYKSISNNGSGSSTNKTNEQKISDYKNSSEYKSIQQQAQNAVVNGDSAKISELHQQALDLQKQYDIAQAKEGGQTPLWGNEGKLMVVHEGELIPNKLQSKDILNASEILKKLNLDNMLTNFNPTNILSKLNLSLPSFNKLQPVIQTTTQTFKFDKIVLPNVTKGDEFIEELKTNFVNYVIQDNGK
jgi:hypothetical protein